MGDTTFLHGETTGLIISTFMDIAHGIKRIQGYPESSIREALFYRLKRKGLRVDQQVEIHSFYQGNALLVGEADLIVRKLVIVSIRRTASVNISQIHQMSSFLRAKSLEVGLIFCYAGKEIVIKRVREYV